MFSHVAILAPGLLGGSIAMALRERAPETRITAWARRPEAATELLNFGLADLAGTTLSEVVTGADLVILCTPIGAMGSLARQIKPFLGRKTLVTDVGSVKGTVVKELEPILGAQFVGSHPMAGSDQTGLAAARADLFEDAVCILTPTRRTSKTALDRVQAFWESLGSRMLHLPADEHDKVVALISHLPHLLAALLVDFVCSENRNALNYAGAGFRDTTRVASGPAGMWAEILEHNRPALQASLRSLICALQNFEPILNDRNATERFLASAKEVRDSIKLPRNNG